MTPKSTKFDPEAARRRFSEAGVEELVRVAIVDAESYAPAAVDLARAELAARGIDGDAHPAATKALRAVKRQKLEASDIAQQPANMAILALSFVFADLFAIIAAIVYSANGRSRAATEVWKAFGFGWLARIVLVVLLMLPWGK
jgi:hypothetical protein